MRMDSAKSQDLLYEDDAAADRIQSAQERRKWVIDFLVPYLRKCGGESTSVKASRALGDHPLRICTACHDARAYVSTRQVLTFSKGNHATTTYITLNKALM